MQSSRTLYLSLLKKCLTRFIFPDGDLDHDLVRCHPFSPELRIQGLDWPTEAETMVGVRRLNNVEELANRIFSEGVPGDFVEAGVWRGGVAIFMRALLAAFGDPDRLVWVADSFEGLPVANPQAFPADEGDQHFTLKPYLGIPSDVVRANFRRYGLLDDRVRFLEGFFIDTLRTSPICEYSPAESRRRHVRIDHSGARSPLPPSFAGRLRHCGRLRRAPVLQKSSSGLQGAGGDR